LVYTARTGYIQHPDMLDVQRARLINWHCGGAVIAPWEVGQLDDHWLNVFKGLQELPKLKENFQAFENLLAKRRAENPTYRKYFQ